MLRARDARRRACGAWYDDAMTTAEKLYTAEEFLALPGDPSGGKMELVEGRVYVMSPVNRQHGRLQLRIGAALAAFVDAHELGEVVVETGYALASGLVRAPDVSYVSGLPASDATGFVAGPPALAVEVWSPGDRESDLLQKVGEYLDAGSGRVWVVRPQRSSLTVYYAGGETRTLHRGDTLTSGDAGFGVEGFALPLSQLFPG